ncbi:MAG: hypothetical protein ABSG72_03980 [Candidatus Sulfotelmatobacter sp.]|jgi:hypothetical protein
MLGISIYRRLLRLYPVLHQEQFGEEMLAVFDDLQAETVSKGILARSVFYARESAGVLSGALLEHWRALGGDPAWLWFPTRRFTMRTEFRFPKTTAVLMTIILAGVMLAIKQGEAISASLRGAADPPIGAIHPVHSVLLGGIVMGFVFFYAAGLIGWTILFAMRRSGVHRLADTSSSPK